MRLAETELPIVAHARQEVPHARPIIHLASYIPPISRSAEKVNPIILQHRGEKERIAYTPIRDARWNIVCLFGRSKSRNPDVLTIGFPKHHVVELMAETVHPSEITDLCGYTFAEVFDRRARQLVEFVELGLRLTSQRTKPDEAIREIGAYVVHRVFRPAYRAGSRQCGHKHQKEGRADSLQDAYGLADLCQVFGGDGQELAGFLLRLRESAIQGDLNNTQMELFGYDAARRFLS